MQVPQHAFLSAGPFRPWRTTARTASAAQAGRRSLRAFCTDVPLAMLPMAFGTITAPARPTAKMMPKRLPLPPPNLPNVTPTVVGNAGANARPEAAARTKTMLDFETPIMTMMMTAAITAEPAIR